MRVAHRCCCTLLLHAAAHAAASAAAAGGLRTLLAHDGHHRSSVPSRVGAARARLQLQTFVGPPRVLPHVASPHP